MKLTQTEKTQTEKNKEFLKEFKVGTQCPFCRHRTVGDEGCLDCFFHIATVLESWNEEHEMFVKENLDPWMRIKYPERTTIECQQKGNF